MDQAPTEFQSGSIRLEPLPFIIQQIVSKSFSGMLEIVLDHQCKRIYFQNGLIVSLESTSVDEQLSELMFRGGILTEESLESINSLVKVTGWNSDEVAKIVDETTRKWWMKVLVREALMSVIHWAEAEYSLVESEPFPAELPVVEMDTIKLMGSMIRRIQDIDILASILGGYERVLKVKSDAFKGNMAKDLTAQDGFFLSRIDGVINLRDVFAMAGSQKLEMARAIVQLCLKGFLELEAASEKKFQQRFMEIHGITEELETGAEQETETSVPDEEPVQESPEDEQITAEHHKMENIMLTTAELKDLRQLAGKMNGDFLDLAKALNLDLSLKPEDVGFDAQISYQRGDKFVDERAGGLNTDLLSRVSLTDDFKGSSDDDSKIAFLIDGKVVDGESDLFGTGLSKEIFEVEDEEKQWNLWMLSEEDLQRDFEKDWTNTWTDWVENTGELSDLRRTLDEMERKLKNTADEKLRENILGELRKKTADVQQLIRRKKREVFSIHRRMQLMTYYELLRVERNASSDIIQAAYDQWESQLSPDDEFIREFSSMAPQIKEIIDLITVAYKVLMDSEARKKYDDSLDERELAADELTKKKVVLAEDHLMSAKTAKRRGDNMLAMRFIRGCISLDPGRAVYYREMAQLLAENKTWRKEALSFYHRAYHLDPKNLELLVDVADLANQLSLDGFAIRALKQVTKLDPSNIRARHLLRKIDVNK